MHHRCRLRLLSLLYLIHVRLVGASLPAPYIADFWPHMTRAESQIQDLKRKYQLTDYRQQIVWDEASNSTTRPDPIKHKRSVLEIPLSYNENGLWTATFSFGNQQMEMAIDTVSTCDQILPYYSILSAR